MYYPILLRCLQSSSILKTDLTPTTLIFHFNPNKSTSFFGTETFRLPFVTSNSYRENLKVSIRLDRYCVFQAKRRRYCKAMPSLTYTPNDSADHSPAPLINLLWFLILIPCFRKKKHEIISSSYRLFLPKFLVAYPRWLTHSHKRLQDRRNRQQQERDEACD